VAIETYDNQLDFNLLVLQQKPSEGLKYQFRQFREIMPRKDTFDPIQKVVVVIDKSEIVIAQTLRQSGKIDFYYAGNRVGTYAPDPSLQEPVIAIDMSFDQTYFQIGNL
jgi:hypothetical protein